MDIEKVLIGKDAPSFDVVNNLAKEGNNELSIIVKQDLKNNIEYHQNILFTAEGKFDSKLEELKAKKQDLEIQVSSLNTQLEITDQEIGELQDIDNDTFKPLDDSNETANDYLFEINTLSQNYKDIKYLREEMQRIANKEFENKDARIDDLNSSFMQMKNMRSQNLNSNRPMSKTIKK